MNRKDFLRLTGFTIPALGMRQPVKQPGSGLVIATWEAGFEVNEAAWKILSSSGRSIDAVEAGARFMENLNSCCVGLDAYPDRDGIVTLDACIMDELGNCGAVAGLEQVRHPISVARKLMEETPHVLLVGGGAQKFALENGFKKESATLSKEASEAYSKWLKSWNYKPIPNIENKRGNGPFAPMFLEGGSPNHDTMGLIAVDQMGKLAGAVTTSGLAFKMHGRVGDSAIIGAGLFVDNEVGAATSSGIGEEVIRIAGSHVVVEAMRQGLSPELACKRAVERIIKRDPVKAQTLQVGFLAINNAGAYGAYSVTSGFTYCVRNNEGNKRFSSKHLLP